MKKKGMIDLIANIILLVFASVVLLLPTLNVTDLKIVLTIIFSVYAIIKLIEFILTFEEKDYESLFTFLTSSAGIIATNVVNLTTKNIALLVLIWMGVMCLIKLKKTDFYHDRKSKMWILRLFMLFVFLTIGLLTGMNLTEDVREQMIVIGNFFFVNSLLDTIDPIVVYLMGAKR